MVKSATRSWSTMLPSRRRSATRRVGERQARTLNRATALARQGAATAGPRAAGRRAALDSLALALAAHDPERVLDRGYAIVADRAGGVVTSAAAAREAGLLRVANWWCPSISFTAAAAAITQRSKRGWL